MFARPFAAACLGNFLYHFIRDIESIAFHGFLSTVVKWRTYALYTFLLALGIWISQLRGQRASTEPVPWHARAKTTATVLFCYCLLAILDEGRGSSISDCGRFFLNLFPSMSF